MLMTVAKLNSSAKIQAAKTVQIITFIYAQIRRRLKLEQWDIRDIPLIELQRPREIHLLISHKEGQLAPQKVCTVGDLVLWDGPLGQTVAGSHPELLEQATFSAHMSQSHFTRSVRTAAVKYQTRVNIGDKPAGCIAQLTMREMANLPQFSHLQDECRVLQEHSYVDDTLTSHNDPEKFKTITQNVKVK